MKLLIGITTASVIVAALGYLAAILILAALILWFVSVVWSAASRIGKGQ